MTLKKVQYYFFCFLFPDETGNQLKQSDAKYLFVAEELLSTAKETVTRCQEIVGFDSRFFYSSILILIQSYFKHIYSVEKMFC